MASNELSPKEINAIKQNYKRNMAKYYANKTSSGPWTRKWLRDIKNMIKNVHKLSLVNISLYHKFVKDKYCLKSFNEESHLMRVIRTAGKEITIPVLPWEDAFNDIWLLHIETGHGDVPQMMNVLKTRCFIDVACVQQVVTLCKLCNKRNIVQDLSIKPILNQRANLEIIDMNFKPDGNNRYILMYTDEATGLLQLRGVVELTTLEVALKLLHIFSDLGPPKVLRVIDSIVDYVSVMDIINKIFLPCCITIDTNLLPSTRSIEIKQWIIDWMKNEGTPNWEIGCYEVQWKINNHGTVKRPAQQLVFEHHNSATCSDVGSGKIPSKSGPFRSTDLPTLDPVGSQMDVIDVPQTSTSNHVPTYQNIYDNDFIKEEPNKDYESVDAFDDEVNITVETKPKAVIKKAVNNKLNVLIECVKSGVNSSETYIAPKPQTNRRVEEFKAADSASSINQDVNIGSHTEPITIEFPEGDNVCSECHMQIIAEAYPCIKCMKNIHYECGEKILGGATDDPLVCWTCEKEMKTKI